VQPLFGIWADRLSSPVLLPGGVALGSVGLGLSGLAGSCRVAPAWRPASRSGRRSASGASSPPRSARSRTATSLSTVLELLPLFALAALALSLSLPGPRQLRTAVPARS